MRCCRGAPASSTSADCSDCACCRRYTAGEPKNVPDLYFGPNGINLGGILVRPCCKPCCKPCPNSSPRTPRPIMWHDTEPGHMVDEPKRYSECSALPSAEQPSQAAQPASPNLDAALPRPLSLMFFCLCPQAWEFLLMHWVEVRRWQDYKNHGSVNQDPIFKGNSVPNEQMGYPGGACLGF